MKAPVSAAQIPTAVRTEARQANSAAFDGRGRWGAEAAPSATAEVRPFGFSHVRMTSDGRPLQCNLAISDSDVH